MVIFPKVAQARIAAATAFALLAACQGGDSPTSPSGPSFAGGTPDVTVSTTADDGPGSLRAAIAAVPDGGVIGFAPSLSGQSIVLATALVIDAKSLTVEASATGGITLDGDGLTRILWVKPTGGLVLRNATVTHAQGDLGAIVTQGALRIEHSTISGNRSVVGNSPGTGDGGAIHHDGGDLTLVNTTISGNEAEERGGGIVSNGPGSITLVHATIVGNTSGASGGGFYMFNPDVQLTIRNSIIAGNSAFGPGVNCFIHPSQTPVLEGTNLFGDAECEPTVHDIVAADPVLGPLAANGGPTRTHALLAGSPAIEAATLGCATVLTDQRYVARPQGTYCDIGAYEFDGFITPPLAVEASATVSPNTGVAVVAGSVTCAAPATLTVRATLRQSQKVGRVNVVIEATGETVVTCGGTRPWSLALVPPSGAFKSGAGTVTAETHSASVYLQTAEVTRSVKMIWGRK